MYNYSSLPIGTSYLSDTVHQIPIVLKGVVQLIYFFLNSTLLLMHWITCRQKNKKNYTLTFVLTAVPALQLLVPPDLLFTSGSWPLYPIRGFSGYLTVSWHHCSQAIHFLSGDIKKMAHDCCSGHEPTSGRHCQQLQHRNGGKYKGEYVLFWC